jgi:hypothetical protein
LAKSAEGENTHAIMVFPAPASYLRVSNTQIVTCLAHTNSGAP